MRSFLLFALALLVSGALGYYFLTARDVQPSVVQQVERTGDRDPVSPDGSPSASSADLMELEGGDAPVPDRAAAAAPATAPEKATEEGRMLTGTVTTAEGEPLAAAQVWVERPGLLRLSGAAQDLDSRVLTDGEGAFTLEVPEHWSGGDQAALHVGKDGYAPFHKRVALAQSGSRDTGTLVLSDGVILSGVVRDEAGRPVADASLHNRTAQEAGVFTIGTWSGREVGRTDDSGRFELQRVPVGDYELTVQHPEHPSGLLRGSAPRSGERIQGLEVVLEEGVTIEGFVVGAPTPTELQVSARPVRSGDLFELSSLSTRRSADVKADGSFEVRGLRRGAKYRLTAREQSTRPTGWVGMSSSSVRSQSALAEAGDRGVQLEYTQGSSLAFRVVDNATGEPVTDFQVAAGVTWAAPLEDEEGKDRTYFEGGVVEIPGLRATEADNTATLKIQATGYEDYSREDIELVGGEDIDLGVVRLDSVPLLHVTVTDAQGDPVEGADVRLAPYSGEASGSFSIRREVRIGGGGDDSDTIEVGGEETRSATTDEKGYCALSSFPGDQVQIKVTARGHARYSGEPLTLPAKGDHTEEIQLSQGGSVLVRVLDPQGVPVSGRKVEHRAPDTRGEMVVIGGGMPGSGQVTNDRGEVLFDSLAVGSHRFRLGGRAGGGASFVMDSVMIATSEENQDDSWSSIEVLDGQEVELVLAAPAVSYLEGRILEAGTPLAGATLRLEERKEGGGDNPLAGLALAGFGGGGTSARTDGKGAYRFDELDAGEYTLTITHAGRVMPTELDVTVDDSGSQFDADLPVTILEGRVVGPDGSPLEGIRVEAKRAQSPGSTRTSIMMVMDNGDDEPVIMTGGGEMPTSTVTDADGYYQLRGVQADVDLTVEGTGQNYQPTRSEVVRVAPGALQDDVDLTMKTAGELTVRVVGTDGNPASALVQARFEAGDGVQPKFQLARGGETTLKGLTPGVWLVSANLMGQEQSAEAVPVEVIANEMAEVTLNLE